MNVVLSLEKKDVKATVMAGTLTNESRMNKSLSDVGVTMLGEVHSIPVTTFEWVLLQFTDVV